MPPLLSRRSPTLDSAAFPTVDINAKAPTPPLASSTSNTDSTFPELDAIDEEDNKVVKRFEHLLTQGRATTPTMPTKAAHQLALSNLPTRTQLALMHHNGKDSIDRCFMTERTFRHILVFIFKSDFLEPTDRRRLYKSCPSTLLLSMMIKQHELVDFRPLRSAVLPSDVTAGHLMHRWSRMFTACLIHYNLDVATAVRFVGNIHTGEHRDWSVLESELADAGLDNGIVADLRRVLVDGCPNRVNAWSSETNRRAFAEYGNHKSVYENPKNTMKAVQKDFLRSHSLIANPLLSSFLPDTQHIPQGLVVVSGKSDRQICDSSYRPHVDSIATNDMTTTSTEFDIIFPATFGNYVKWIYNLRISYPTEEIFLGDDDVSGAFRHAKWNPNVIGMNTFLIFGFIFFCTGLTFGNNTCPANWEIIAVSRMLLAQALWSKFTTIERIRKYLPPIATAPGPTPTDIDAFTPALSDSLNVGVFNDDGSRMSPPFGHHVDDCLYADVKQFLLQTIAASVLALYLILGFPDKNKGIRDCISWEKFTSIFSHRRKALGWMVDSRTLTVSLPHDKRDRLIARLQEVQQDPRLTLLEIAQILGLLSHATTVCRHMRCSFYNLQRLLSISLVSKYQCMKGYRQRQALEAQFSRELPRHLFDRLQGLVSRQMATTLWASRQKFHLDVPTLRELQRILSSLQSEEWQVSIPHMIPREPHCTSIGDASFIGGGAYSYDLRYWFRLIWSHRVVCGTKKRASDPGYIHINTLEFLVAFLQVVALVVILELPEWPDYLQEQFPKGLPPFPLLCNRTDNTATKSWTNDVSKISLDETLSHLPAECRTNFSSAVGAFMRLEAGSTATPRVARTTLTRRLNFISFLHRLEWPADDYLLEHVSHKARTTVLAAYTIDLAQGNTVKGKPIKSGTINCYLRDVASLIAGHCGRDPRYLNPASKELAPSIKAVLDECKRYEGMPQRADAYTTAMHETLMTSNDATDAHRDGLLRALEDFNNIGSYLGCRLREYAQDNEHKELKTGGEVAPNGTKRAFTLDDIKIYDAHGRPVTIATFLRNRRSVRSAIITFSWQKNNDHGEARRLVMNIHFPSRDPITSLHNLLCRFDRLVGIQHTNTPLAVYKDTTQVMFLHSRVISTALCTLAQKHYGLSASDLKKHYRYTPHSIRVGAAVLLHSAGATETQLKFLLRWRSDAFFAYLRNLPHLANEQNLAFLRMAQASLQLPS